MKEYLRFYLVYGVAFVMSLVLLPLLVEGFGINSYLSAALLLPVGVLLSFFGHSKISFKESRPSINRRENRLRQMPFTKNRDKFNSLLYGESNRVESGGSEPPR